MRTIESLLNPCPSKLLFCSKSLLKPNSIDSSSSIFSPVPRLRKFGSSLSIRCSVTQWNRWLYPDYVPSESRASCIPRRKIGIHKFGGKTIVVKYGGAVMQSPSRSLLTSVVMDLVFMSMIGVRPILVHGGGLEINDLLNTVHKSIVAMVNKDRESAEGPYEAELDFVISEVARVDPTVLEAVLEKGNIPVVCSVAAEGCIDADTVAGEIAGAVGAERLIFMTDVAGILKDRDDPKSRVMEMDIKGVKKMMEEGKIGGGMISKVNCCVRSLAQGVRAAIIIDGRRPSSLLLTLSVDNGLGTMIVA